MKRSEINKAKLDATACFERHGWTLPPEPKWDITDFGFGSFATSGLVLVNLAEEAEYCEKLMYARRGQEIPAHYHKRKKEDIICRSGELAVQLWQEDPALSPRTGSVSVKVNGVVREVPSGETIVLRAGERVTLVPYVWHAFHSRSEECVIGEVSTANDDVNDNFFSEGTIARFPEIEEDQTEEIAL